LFPHTMPIALGGGHRAPYWIFVLQGHCPEHETKGEQDAYREEMSSRVF
jgi:hypothetical protein